MYWTRPGRRVLRPWPAAPARPVEPRGGRRGARRPRPAPSPAGPDHSGPVPGHSGPAGNRSGLGRRAPRFSPRGATGRAGATGHGRSILRPGRKPFRPWPEGAAGRGREPTGPGREKERKLPAMAGAFSFTVPRSKLSRISRSRLSRISRSKPSRISRSRLSRISRSELSRISFFIACPASRFAAQFCAPPLPPGNAEAPP